MKDIKITILAAVLISCSAFAQNKATEKADKLFKRLKFVDAIEAYNKVIENGDSDAYVYGQLAEANFNVYNTEEAERWYAKALVNEANPEMVYNYAQMLKANGKYDESNSQMDKFSSLKPKDKRAQAYKSNNGYLPRLLNAKPNYGLENVDFNSEYSEFGGTVDNDMLYFSSARNTSRKKYGYKGEPFLDVYIVPLSEESAEAIKVKGINTKHHEGLVTFGDDGNTIYFTRESFYNNQYEKLEGDKTKFSVQHLFKAKKVGDNWKEEEALAFNSDKYSVRNPSLTKDGKTLYFESNMPGGFGMYDIYKVSVNDDGTFGEPINMGDIVNTEANEAFPYISSTNTLYFSSTGHLGLGGLDVFEFKNGEVNNLGLPVNSPADDLAFTINEDSKEGFVSSNREGGKGGDDIYKITRLVPQYTDMLVTVTNSETNEPVVDALVEIRDKDGVVVLTEKTNSKGQINYRPRQETSLNIKTLKADYESSMKDYTAPPADADEVQVLLKPIEKIIVKDEVILNPILFEFDKSNITAQGAFELDKLVAVMAKYPNMVIDAGSHTDYIGRDNYNLRLSERRAQSTVQYVISKGINASRISGKGYGETQPKVLCGNKCTDEQRQMNRRSEFKIVSGGPQ
jgi:outer membrane protein OmpA-like peptidoglycan-associated protein/tetratricopeptide (TPR) repeat protein